jgi:hypothetical protein
LDEGQPIGLAMGVTLQSSVDTASMDGVC